MSKSPSLRRIQADIRELSLDPSDQYTAAPLEHDMFEWHFTIRGAPETDFAGGIYHGRILLPPEYPLKPPHIVFLTPSGRFETNTKICLSFSAFHPELWQPAWGIRLILEALISFLPTPADGAVGALDWTGPERQKLAQQSKQWCCPQCGKIEDLLLPEGSGKKSVYAKEIEELQRLQQQEHAAVDTSNDEKAPAQEEASSSEAPPLVQEEPAVTTTSTDVVEDESNHTSAVEEPPVVTQEEPPAVATDLPQPLIDEEGGTAMDPSEPLWMSDPVLHILIVLLSLLCYLLACKINRLLQDLDALEEL